MSTRRKKNIIARVVENKGKWSENEHRAFVKGLVLYGKDWKRIHTLVPSRTLLQIRTHAQKYLKKQADIRKAKNADHNLSSKQESRPSPPKSPESNESFEESSSALNDSDDLLIPHTTAFEQEHFPNI